VHLVGFIIKKFVTMHGHMNVKQVEKSDLASRMISHSILTLTSDHFLSL